MNKEQFVKRMRLIQNYHSELDTLSVLGEKIFDGYCIPKIGNCLIDEIIHMINEVLNIEDEELLFWWLYEDVEKVIYFGEHGENSINVSKLEDLYDYIINTNKK